MKGVSIIYNSIVIILVISTSTTSSASNSNNSKKSNLYEFYIFCTTEILLLGGVLILSYLIDVKIWIKKLSLKGFCKLIPFCKTVTQMNGLNMIWIQIKNKYLGRQYLPKSGVSQLTWLCTVLPWEPRELGYMDFRSIPNSLECRDRDI